PARSFLFSTLRRTRISTWLSLALHDNAPWRSGPFAQALQAGKHSKGGTSVCALRRICDCDPGNSATTIALQNICRNRRDARVSTMEIPPDRDDCSLFSLLRRGYPGSLLWPARDIVHERQRTGDS